MLSSVLNSERAIEVNIAIMRAFVKLRQLLESNEELNRKFAAVIRKLATHDKYFTVVFDELKKLNEPQIRPRKQIGFNPRSGRQHKAWGVSPRSNSQNTFEPAKRRQRSRLQNAIVMIRLSPAPRALIIFQLALHYVGYFNCSLIAVLPIAGWLYESLDSLAKMGLRIPEPRNCAGRLLQDFSKNFGPRF
jgi:hypothetical protein